jgi:phage terminase large subunit-like protein
MIRRTIPTEEGGRYYFDASAADAAVAFFREKLTLTVGEWAGRPFEPADLQETIIRDLFGWKRTDDGTRRFRVAFIWVPRKFGKFLDVDTPIPTPGGWRKMGDLREGDLVFSEYGDAVRVVAAYAVERDQDCYEIAFSDGTSVVAGHSHEWAVETKSHGKRVARTFTVAEMFARGVKWRGKGGRHKYSIRSTGPNQGGSGELPIDPYLFGLWLGDGTSADGTITLNDRDRPEIMTRLGTHGYELTQRPGRSCTAVRFKGLRTQLREIGALGNKHIPERYLWASVADRRELLRGIIDTDGFVQGSQVQIESVFPALARDITTLARSLGFKVTLTECDGSRKGRPSGPIWRVQFSASLGDNVFGTTNHTRRSVKTRRELTTQIVDIQPVPSRPLRCITVDNPTGLFRCGLGMVPTHNSEFAAGLGLLLLLGDDEPAAEVYCIATNEDQARIIFDRAVSMVVASDELSTELTAYKNHIWYHSTASKIAILTGKPTGKHGLVTYGILADECHEWPDDELYTFVHQAEGNRNQPLDIFVSTAGKKKGPGWEYYQTCEAILAGDVVDPSTYVVIASADAERNKTDTEYWTTEEAWSDANPNYPVTPKKSYLESECARAQGSPRQENNFKKYHLNLWVEQDTRWLNMTRWDACEHSDWRTMRERMKGRRCVAGVDLSAVTDLTSRVLLFPPEDDDPTVDVQMTDGSIATVKLWRVLSDFWIPRARMNDRIRIDKQPFDKWERAGAIIATPGDVIDQNAIHKALLQDAEDFDLAAVMVDRWNATQFTVNLNDEGLDAALFGQGFASMSGPAKWLERSVLLQRLDHGGHPVMRWNASNVAVVEDHADNIKPSKEASADRIDGIVALVMAAGGCDEHLTDDADLWEIVPANQK